jgi:hypothetical protein
MSISKPIISIVGWSGSGKSTSLRGLDPATTVIIDLEQKGFPFRGGEKFKVIPCANIAQVDKAISDTIADQSVKVIIIESLTKYFEYLLSLAQTSFKGFDVWNYYNKSIGNMLNKVKNNHAVVVFSAIDEIVKIPNVDGTEQAQRRISVKGKEWEGKVEKEMLIVFFTDVRKNKDGKMEYSFMTNTDGICSAKSPMDMFVTQMIPNDLAAAIKQMEDYYK